MKILFIMRHSGHIRLFESTIRLLAEHGHSIWVGFNLHRDPLEASSQRVEELSQELPTVSFGYAPPRSKGPWANAAKAVRLSVDYLRYLDPRFKDAASLRARAEDRAPRFLVSLSTLPIVRSAIGRRLLGSLLNSMERAIPTDPLLDRFISDQHADLLLVTPLVDIGSPQVDYVKSAKRLGIRTGLCVCSWDNLTNKGLIRIIPDIVTVWNEMQKTEAVELHGVSPSQVIVTGAQTYDHWFVWQPSSSREEFCKRVGLDADKPFFLYLCSSSFITPRETRFVTDWIQALRNAPDPRLREVGVLVRPHPKHAEQWREVDFSSFGNVAVWPREGADPISSEAKSGFYDSLYYSVAVVGVNTSAQIEAGILGKPVYTVLDPEFAGTQEGTLHFHHLLNVNGGLLYVARDLTEHLSQVSAVFGGGEELAQKSRRFVESFVRPQGLDMPATPLLVAAIEQTANAPLPSPERLPLWYYPLRWFCWFIGKTFKAQRKQRHTKKDRIAYKIGKLGEKRQVQTRNGKENGKGQKQPKSEKTDEKALRQPKSVRLHVQ